MQRRITAALETHQGNLGSSRSTTSLPEYQPSCSWVERAMRPLSMASPVLRYIFIMAFMRKERAPQCPVNLVGANLSSINPTPVGGVVLVGILDSAAGCSACPTREYFLTGALVDNIKRKTVRVVNSVRV